MREHGVGIGKTKDLNEELGEGTVNLMKRPINPPWVVNPGKVSIFFLIVYFQHSGASFSFQLYSDLPSRRKNGKDATSSWRC
jgi:FAD linked oxidases, C-terminal domain